MPTFFEKSDSQIQKDVINETKRNDEQISDARFAAWMAPGVSTVISYVKMAR